MIKLIKKIKRVLNEFDCVKESAEAALNISNDARRYIKKATTIGIDVSPIGRDPNVVFVMGRYRYGDYVQGFSIRDKDFSEIISILKSMENVGNVTRIDAPRDFEVFAKRELKRNKIS